LPPLWFQLTGDFLDVNGDFFYEVATYEVEKIAVGLFFP